MSSDRRSETPITGSEIAEPVQPRGPFYRAFNERDFALMADNGEVSECVARDNPLRPAALDAAERLMSVSVGVCGLRAEDLAPSRMMSTPAGRRVAARRGRKQEASTITLAGA